MPSRALPSRLTARSDRSGQAAPKLGVEKRRDEAALLAACRKGDEAAWAEIVKRYRRLVYSIPFACGLDADAADDVFQRVVALLVENVAKIRDASGLASWLATTTRRECWALARDSRRSRGFEEGEAENRPDESPETAERLHLVECEHALALALEGLGEPCRTIIAALYVEDPTPSYEELARRLGRPIGSLGPTRQRCLARLRKLYEAQGGSPPFGADE
jgi:RNA polymerase sigma factor (sigma-70 family)